MKNPFSGCWTTCSGGARWSITTIRRERFTCPATGARKNKNFCWRDPVTAGRVCVDSGSLEEIEEVIIRDRKHLSEDGIVVHIIAIDKHTGKMESHPEIVTRGLMSDNGQELIAGARVVIMKTVEESNAEEKSDWGVIKEKIRVDLKRYISKQTSKRPLILPVILEV